MRNSGKNKYLFLLLVFLALRANAGILTGSLNRTTGTLEDQFEYTLEISGSIQSEPQFPDVPGLQVVSRSQSSSIQIINGRTSRQITLSYILQASREGSFNIPPIEVKLDGQIEKTLPLSLTIRSLSIKERRSRPLYAEQVLSSSNLYEGQASVLTLKLFSNYRVEGDPGIIPPSLSGLRIKPLGDPSSSVQTINNKKYQVIEARYVVVADKSTIQQIPPFVFRVALSTGRRGFFSFGPEVRDVRSNSLDLKVKGLPLKGRATSFSGLVGDFEGQVEVANRQVKVGENVPVFIKIKGDGETTSMAVPKLDFLDQKFKVYKDKPSDSMSISQDLKIASSKVLNFAVVPQFAGDFSLGKLAIQYFSPSRKSYQTLELELGQIKVEGQALATSISSPTTAVESFQSDQLKQQVTMLGKDIVGLHPARLLRKNEVLSFKEWLIAVILTGLFLISTPIAYVVRRNMGVDTPASGRARYAKAYKKFTKTIKNIKSEHNEQAKVVQLQNSLKIYLGDKFDTYSGSLTEKDIANFLDGKGVARDIVDSTVALFTRMNRILYAPQTKAEDTMKIMDDTNKVVRSIEKQC